MLLLVMLALAGCGRDITVPAPSPAPSRGTHHEPPVTEWPFSLPRDTAVFTLKRILDGSKPILYVVHDVDGDWQFLDGDAATEDDAALVSLEEIAEQDPSVKSLADLPQGWSAERKNVGSPWKRLAQ